MQGLFYDGNAAMYRTDVPVPEIRDGESLIRILISAVCNTDREVLKGYKPDFSGIMGHEFVGVVERSSNPDMVGKRVVGELNEGCGDCIYCKTMREHHCINRRVIGLANRDGCFADYMVTVTRLLHVVPDNLTDEQAVCTEPLAAAFEITQQVHVQPGTEVCVIGDGRLSYMISQVLALTGAGVTVLGRHEEKLEKFKGFANTCIQTDRSFEIVVDACGAKSGINTAAKIVRKCGTIVMKSTYAGNADINLSQFVVGEINLVGSRCGPFEPALRLMSRGLIDLPAIELHKLSDWENAFESTAFKAGFDFRK